MLASFSVLYRTYGYAFGWGKPATGMLTAQAQALREHLAPVAADTPINKVTVGTDGRATIAAVDFTIGSLYVKQVRKTQIETAAARLVRKTFASNPKLGEVDISALKPIGMIGNRQRLQVVFSAAVRRAVVSHFLPDTVPAADLLGAAGRLYWAPYIVDRAGPPARRADVEDTSLKGVVPDNANLAQPDATTKIPVVIHGRSTKPMVALTFDDGPHPVYTPLILDLLDRYHVKATFFVVGLEANLYPEFIHRMAAAGHIIGNHTYSHARLAGLTLHEVQNELEFNDNIIEGITGKKTHWYRPPGGWCTADDFELLSRLHYVPVLWTENTGDWANPPARDIVARALHGLHDGSVILMHCDGICTVDALPTIIDTIRARGFSLGTVADITREHGPQLMTPDAVMRFTLRCCRIGSPEALKEHLERAAKALLP